MKALTFRLSFIALMFSALVGCAPLQQAYDAVTGATVNNKAVYVGASTVDALEVTAINYLKLPRCTGANGPVCRDPAATKTLAPLLRSAVAARKKVVQYAIDHPGQVGSSGLYDAMTTAYTQLKDMLSYYGISPK